ncbi:MAG: SGNH/GDSL hydrolase family protein [Acidimicrobiales bacterium]|nr:SGNH/GDSL hydrolase family protein [Acidimicrobiales bacterium]
MSRRSGRLAGLVSALAIMVSSCVTGTWTGNNADPSVVVIGDSLVFISERSGPGGTETWITDDLVAGGAYGYVTGWIGSTLWLGYEVAWESPSRQGIIPDVLVVALGTNDMRIFPGETEPGGDVEKSRLDIKAWLAEVPAACVVLVGVAENIWGWGLDVSGPAWNAMLADEAALHANATYVPWEPDLAWVSGGSQPHPNSVGRVAYRDLIVAEALDCAGL